MGLKKEINFDYIDLIFISSIVASLGSFIYFIVDDKEDNIIISGSVLGGITLIYIIVIIIKELYKNTVYNAPKSRVQKNYSVPGIDEEISYAPKSRVQYLYPKPGIEYGTEEPKQSRLLIEGDKTIKEIIKERELESAEEEYKRLLNSGAGLINSPKKETDILKEIVRLKKELNILENNRALEREAGNLRNFRNEINTGEIKTLKNPRVIRDDDVEAAARDSTSPLWMKSLEFSDENKN